MDVPNHRFDSEKLLLIESWRRGEGIGAFSDECWGWFVSI
jgi:hypothetical protein